MSEFGKTNNSKVTTKPSTGTNTASFTQATSARQPVTKSVTNANSNVLFAVTSLSCDGSNYMSLASSQSVGGFGNAYTVIVCFAGADYTSDTYLVSSSTGDGHIGIESGGTGIIFKPATSKSAQRSLVTNTGNGSSVSHTFGSDVEMIAFVSEGDNNVNVYNIDGNLITTDGSAGNSVAFPIDHILGKSDGTLGLNGELLDIAVYDSAFSASIIKGLGNKYKTCKNI
ncbi:MAG: hypothetical protein NWE77_06720 [Candidatus Bathyarchaeota archaeon]|nr:hypothetical protein [Candidatus Bathyarchaeota archaeon]